MQAKARDIRAALATWPDGRTWGRCALVYFGFLAVALPIGIAAGLIQPSAPWALAGAGPPMLVIALHPAFTEELLFRVLLLPRRGSGATRARLTASVLLAIAVYVAVHPIASALLQPAHYRVFTNPLYLLLVGLLGLACSVVYLMSGSIWPGVFMHWLTVVLWLFMLGGQRLLTAGAAP